MKDLRQKTARGVIWSFVDKAGSQFAGFLITVLLARLLSPAEFGLIAMASVFFAISRAFIDSGLRDSLIQKKDATQLDYNTVFYFNLGVGLLVYAVIFVAAPFFAEFYGYPELTRLIRVLAVIVIIHSFSIVQVAILTKELRFKEFLKIRFPAVIVSGAVGLFLAYQGYGVWALVVQMILEDTLFNILIWRLAHWYPGGKFDADIFRFHWRHGSRLLVAEIIIIVYRNIFSLVIGKSFGPALLGLYSRADSFIVVTFNNSTGLIQAVSYPALAQIQENDAKLKNVYRKILQTTLLATLPIYLVFILQAEGIIQLLLTSKWLGAAPILVVLSFAAILSPFNSINLNILKAKRRTDLYLRLQIISKLFIIGIVVLTAYLGFNYLIFTNLIAAILALFINNYFANKLIHYTLKEQIRDMLPLMIAFAATLGVVGVILAYVHVSDMLLLRFIGNAALIAGIFYGVIFFIRREFIMEAWGMLKDLMRRNKA